MKQWIILLFALIFALGNSQAAPESQTLDQINAAAREQVIRELKLSSAQRKRFEPIYTAYRAALDRAIAADANAVAGDETAQRNNLKAKLGNISATAQVKREYVDKFAEVLTAEQIRTLYNTEGSIATSLHRMDAQRSLPMARKLKGSRRMATQDRGNVGMYTGISAASFINVKISATARTAIVTANDNAIDYVELINTKGVLQIRLNAQSTENLSISVVLPASSALAELNLSGYAKLQSDVPIKAPNAKINLSGGASLETDVETTAFTLGISGYSKFNGDIRTGDCRLDVSGGASVRSDVACTGNCKVGINGYSKFNGSIKAASMVTAISGGALLNGAITANKLTLAISGYAKYNGAMDVRGQAELSATGGASVSGAFTAADALVKLTGYAKINLTGTGTVGTIVASVTSGATFNAPELRVSNYRFQLSSYAKADVWCSDKLTASTTSGAKFTYSGPVSQVEITTDGIQRKQ